MMRSNLGSIVLGLAGLLLLPSVASATGSGGYDTGWGDTAAPDETEGDDTGGTADTSGGGGDTGGGSSPATSGMPSSDSGTTGEESATEGETDGDMEDGAVDRGCTIGAGSPSSGLAALAVLGLLALRRRHGSRR
ncbi:MYXO-CTERM sorting domain-containing protein [Paraliomyxa miuraensis]|uniref:MYXO-CTERM sorting domain-containing protein n=1 Tax=Paraliomyxa miuraensis TaxID=376150 RepID=UPI00225B1234|nr:MYXO-CTERM sorting domain-containing protein [Paraliomyxa miuraensis]MCX4243716.1 MYXO-CTERM sorting domain-containing protein [Paraliomyxa miuraensis]